MLNNLPNEERETHLNLVADNRQTWHVFSDDPVMIAHLDKVARFVRVVGFGKEYELDANQVTIRRTPVISEATRIASSERMKLLRAKQLAEK